MIIQADAASKIIEKKLQSIPTATRRGIRKAFYHIGRDLQRTARNEIMKPGRSGRIYDVYISPSGRKLSQPRKHQASARGEYPANLTGTLQRSIGFTVRGSNSLFFGSSAEYAPFLELEKYLYRPFLISAINENEKNTQRYFELYIGREF